MFLCPETFTKLLMKMEVTAEGQIVPSALAGPGRTRGAAVWLLAMVWKQILLWTFERKQEEITALRGMTILQLHLSWAKFVRNQCFCNPVHAHRHLRRPKGLDLTSAPKQSRFGAQRRKSQNYKPWQPLDHNFRTIQSLSCPTQTSLVSLVTWFDPNLKCGLRE